MDAFFYYLTGIFVMKLIMSQSNEGTLYKVRTVMYKDLVLSTFVVQLIWPLALFVFVCLYLKPIIEAVIEKLEK